MIVRLIFPRRQAQHFHKRFWQYQRETFNCYDLLLWDLYKNLWAESYHAFLLTGWWLLLYRQRNTGRSHKGIWKGTDKRITLLKTHCPVTAKRTCKVSDLTSPLLYHSDVGCVHSVKGLPYGVSASPCSLTSLRFLFFLTQQKHARIFFNLTGSHPFTYSINSSIPQSK